MVKNIFSNRLQNTLYVDKVMVPLGMENTTPNGWDAVDTSSDSIAAIRQAEENFFQQYGVRLASVFLNDGSVARGTVHGTQSVKCSVQVRVAYKEYRDGTTDYEYTGVLNVDACRIRYGAYQLVSK